MKQLKKYTLWVLVGVGALLLFLFFFQQFPYHLMRKEQMMLFMYAEEPLLEYWKTPGGLAAFLGDFFMQFYYYVGGAPIVLTALLVLWGYLLYRLFKPYLGKWSFLPVVLLLVWEAGRSCNLIYPLEGTWTFVGYTFILLLCRWLYRQSHKHFPLCLLLLGVAYYLFGCGNWDARFFYMPNRIQEKLLALDVESYFNDTKEVERILATEEFRNTSATYYYNLHHAKQGNLPDKLMDYYQPATTGLFLPVLPSATPLSIYSANELWFALGDMTMAEHAAILGMIFSPRHTGVRAIKRLAEINLITGDDVAAMKYLRMLQKTLCYSDWANRRMPGNQTEEVKNWIKRKQSMLPDADTLRLAGDVALSLRQLLRANPQNGMARDYLLCYDLLTKNIAKFAQDYQEFAKDMLPSRLYAEGLLIYLAGSGASPEEVRRFCIPNKVLQDFAEYTQIYEANEGNGIPLQGKYGKSYWFYFHYATIKSDK